MARLASHLQVGALLRRAHAAGGSAMLLARGDHDSGAILVVVLDKGAEPQLYERGIGPDGRAAIVAVGAPAGDSFSLGQYLERRRARDPDLWIVELDVAGAERFIAETISGD